MRARDQAGNTTTHARTFSIDGLPPTGPTVESFVALLGPLSKEAPPGSHLDLPLSLQVTWRVANHENVIAAVFVLCRHPDMLSFVAKFRAGYQIHIMKNSVTCPFGMDCIRLSLSYNNGIRVLMDHVTGRHNAGKGRYVFKIGLQISIYVPTPLQTGDKKGIRIQTDRFFQNIMPQWAGFYKSHH